MTFSQFDLDYSKLISWSKNGFIAYSFPTKNSKDNLLLTYLENVDGESWQLAKPISINIKLENNLLPTLSFLSWSTLSTDLAVADVYGNVFILLAGVGILKKDDNERKLNKIDSNGQSPSYELTSYDNLEMIYRDLVHPEPVQELSSSAKIVSLKWLNIEKVQIINKPAVPMMQDNVPLSYSYGISQYQPRVTTHPIVTKQACVAVRQNGELMLYYQGEHKVEYYKLSSKLSEGPIFIEKALFGFYDKNTIILTVYEVNSSKIITFSCEIDWGFLEESAKKQKNDPHYQTPLDARTQPKIVTRKIHEMMPLPTYVDNTDYDEDYMDIDNESNNQSNSYLGRISSIDILSAYYEKESRLNILVSYEVENENNAISTTIYRYDLKDHASIVSEAFDNLGSRKGIAKLQEEEVKDYTLDFQDKIVRNGRVVSIESCFSDSLILITYDNMKVDIIDRTSMNVVNDPEHVKADNTIENFYDVGYELPSADLRGQFFSAISPNLTSIIYCDLTDEVKSLTLKLIAKPNSQRLAPDDIIKSSVFLAHRHAYACYTNTCTDDLMILIQQEVKSLQEHPQMIEKLVKLIICESHKAINFHLDDFGKESVDKLLSNPPLQKLLSLQLILGEFLGENNTISDISWIILNLRSTSFGIMFLLSSIYRQISKKKPANDTLQDSIARGECIMSLVGSLKWLIDLTVLFNQELLQLSHNRKDDSDSILNLKNSVALPILLSKVPRLFLMYALSSIGKTLEVLKKLHKDLTDSNKLMTPMKEALNRYFTVCNQIPLTLSIFESFLREIDELITKELYSKFSSKEKGYSLRLEQKLVCQGEVPEELLPLANKIIEKYAISISRDLKVSDLYFYDVDWIDAGVNSSHRSKKNLSSPVINNSPNLKDFTIPRLKNSDDTFVDALRKIVISINGKFTTRNKFSNGFLSIRKCTRCRSMSLSSDPLVFDSPHTIGLWTMVFQRTCVCGSAWVTLYP